MGIVLSSVDVQYFAKGERYAVGSDVGEIGEHAFVGCRSLKEIIVPPTVKKIKAGAFQYCTGLRTVILPNNLTEIPDNAFRDCPMLENITLPENLQKIGDYAFNGCHSLKEIELPKKKSLEIGFRAFFDTRLSSILLPDNVNKIGMNAFSQWTEVLDEQTEKIARYIWETDYILYCLDENGIIRKKFGKEYKEQYADGLLKEYQQEIKEEMIADGYNLRNDYFVRLLQTYANKPWTDLLNYIQKRIELKEYNRQKQAEKDKRWADLYKKFNGKILGLDIKHFDVYDKGFSVEIVMSSGLSREERLEYVKTHKKDIIKWCMEEIGKEDKLTKKIGDVSYYKPSEIVIMKNPRVMVSFVVKKEVNL